ncbi:hypothetical protein OHB14_61950 [Streptomyces sp. NBC_01613]|uniref:hypothetical protein n=1 Tax=Streptomyces sp. NBC_01613 TaxID=2975896 RepID=UPI0038660A28
MKAPGKSQGESDEVPIVVCPRRRARSFRTSLRCAAAAPDNITAIVADVLNLNTRAGQLADAPVVVGAVAENQLHDNGVL